MSVYGYRAWLVDPAGYLRPLTFKDTKPWGAGLVHATCRFMGGTHEELAGDEPVPARDCTCGLYAWKHPLPPCACDKSDRGHPATGVVEMAGRIVEHEHGWRAQQGRIVAIVDFTGRLSDDYRCVRYPTIEAMNAVWAVERPRLQEYAYAARSRGEFEAAVAAGQVCYCGAVSGTQREYNMMSKDVDRLRGWLARADRRRLATNNAVATSMAYIARSYGTHGVGRRNGKSHASGSYGLAQPIQWGPPGRYATGGTVPSVDPVEAVRRYLRSYGRPGL